MNECHLLTTSRLSRDQNPKAKRWDKEIWGVDGEVEKNLELGASTAEIAENSNCRVLLNFTCLGFLPRACATYTLGIPKQ